MYVVDEFFEPNFFVKASLRKELILGKHVHGEKTIPRHWLRAKRCYLDPMNKRAVCYGKMLRLWKANSRN